MNDDDQNPAAEQWLIREDRVCHASRLERLMWITDKAPRAEYWTFPGGLMAKYLFEESRYCFVYGQFFAAIVLGLSYIERTLAALFYGSGRNDLQRAGISILLQEAVTEGWISQTEFEDLHHARAVRNPIIHFREPGHATTIENRSLTQSELPDAILENDAHYVIKAVLHLLAKQAIQASGATHLDNP